MWGSFHFINFLLETSEILFRGERRSKVMFSAVKSAKVAGDWLVLETAEGKFELELGAATAGKWAQKILHPKTRLEKLGVKAGSRVVAIGELDPEFAAELKKLKAEATGKICRDTEIVFLACQTKDQLNAMAKIAKQIEGATALWVVYPKGRKDITEGEVIAAGRAAGLKDVKVVGFSATHTALKFVIPVSQR
jgi:hypothetical protein